MAAMTFVKHAPQLDVPIAWEANGTARIGNTRVTLDAVVGRFKSGDPPTAIADGFDSLSLGDVYAVIAYYLGHAEEVDAYLRERGAQSEAAWERIESDPKNKAFRARMAERRATGK